MQSELNSTTMWWLFTAVGVGCCCYGLFFGLVVCFVDCDVQLAFFEKFGKSPRVLKNKVVFITGASSGIGENTAIALAKYGVKLVLTGRREDQLKRVKDECIAISKGKLTENDVLILVMDMTKMSTHQEYFNRALNHFGKIDILLNNAGRSQRALWENIELDVDKQMFDLNVFSVVSLTRIAVQYFNKKGNGHVAVTSSIAGLCGVPYSGTYVGSKYAINGYYAGLRTEKIGQKLTVSVFCPGPIFTNFLAESFTEKNGQKYGIAAKKSDRRMTGERCGELFAIALANRTNESWMGLFPIIPFTYGAVYFPLITNTFLRIVGPNLLYKLRDSKDATLNETDSDSKRDYKLTDELTFVTTNTKTTEKQR